MFCVFYKSLFYQDEKLSEKNLNYKQKNGLILFCNVVKTGNNYDETQMFGYLFDFYYQDYKWAY